MKNPPTEDELKEIYARAGHALYWAQCFEQSLADYLSLYGRMTGQVATADDLASLRDDADAKTMGQLLRKAKELIEFDGDAEPVVTEALKKRNHFAHRFFKEHEGNFASDAGREEMIEILKGYASLFKEADHIFSSANMAIAKQLGISDPEMEAEFAKRQVEVSAAYATMVALAPDSSEQ